MPTILIQEPTVVFRKRLSFLPRTAMLAACSVLFVEHIFLSATHAQTSRIVTENGITYRETRQIVQHPVSTIENFPHQETTYKLKTETKREKRMETVYVPVTHQVWERRVDNWWNLLADPAVSYHPVVVTQWQLQQREVEVPVTTQTYVPETRVVQKPTRVLRFEKRENVSRVAVSTPPVSKPSLEAQGQVWSSSAANVANRPLSVGVQKYGGTTSSSVAGGTTSPLFR